VATALPDPDLEIARRRFPELKIEPWLRTRPHGRYRIDMVAVEVGPEADDWGAEAGRRTLRRSEW